VATCVISATESNLIPARTKLSETIPNAVWFNARNAATRKLLPCSSSCTRSAFIPCAADDQGVADAEDLTQEAFLQVFRNVNSFPRRFGLLDLALPNCGEHVLMKLRRVKHAILRWMSRPAESPSLKRAWVGGSNLSEQWTDCIASGH